MVLLLLKFSRKLFHSEIFTSAAFFLCLPKKFEDLMSFISSRQKKKFDYTFSDHFNINFIYTANGLMFLWQRREKIFFEKTIFIKKTTRKSCRNFYFCKKETIFEISSSSSLHTLLSWKKDRKEAIIFSRKARGWQSDEENFWNIFKWINKKTLSAS